MAGRGRGKKAQVYVIAAVIIMISIIALAGVSNYIIVEKEPKGFYDLGENLGLEGAWVVDYGIYVSDSEISSVIETFVKSYADYIAETGEKFELAIVYGNNEQGILEIYNKTSTGGAEYVDIGGVRTYSVEKVRTETFSGGYKQFVINDNSYEINLKENQNFLFVLTTNRGFETYIQENV